MQAERPSFLRTVLAFLLLAPGLSAQTHPTYFLLGPSPLASGAEQIKQSQGTAVIPLTKASDISHARKLIESPGTTGFAHPVVRVRAGNIGINRNFYEADWPEYSWYPFQVVAFADGITGNTATTPKLLESTVNWSNPSGWDESRTVGFADLTVVKELGVAPVFLKVRRGVETWEFDWIVLQPLNGDFTVEAATSLDGSWEAVPGNWPTQATHWTANAGDLPSGTVFLRVRVDLTEG